MNVQDRLYIIVRSDLKPGLVVAQACHTAIEAQRKWNLSENHYLVVLDGGKSEDDMLDLLDRVVWGYPLYQPAEALWLNEYLEFREPDLDDEVTGIAIQPGREPSWVRSLSLLFSKGGEHND